MLSLMLGRFEDVGKWREYGDELLRSDSVKRYLIVMEDGSGRRKRRAKSKDIVRGFSDGVWLSIFVVSRYRSKNFTVTSNNIMQSKRA